MITNATRILTGSGGEWAVTGEAQTMLALTDANVLYVSSSHLFNHHVRGFISRYKRMTGREPEIKQVDMAEISAFYRDAKNDASMNGNRLSSTQFSVTDLFNEAVQKQATDIHIRCSTRTDTQILQRIMGDLIPVRQESYTTGMELIRTIYQTMTDVSDPTLQERIPQDARVADPSKLPKGVDGIRVATAPQVNGMIMVMRLLYNDPVQSSDLESLGFDALHTQAVEVMKSRPTGLNIISGPTGAGKSTTLQRILTGIYRDSGGRKNIMTVEDPPEYTIEGAVQQPVSDAETEEERSAAFQRAIKATLRLDPDVLMIGEMRDTPSAGLALRAAMTGHQVWSTVHANSAFDQLYRLIDMGLSRDLVFDPNIITGLVAQRLVKKLCPHCKEPFTSVYHDSDDEQLAKRFRRVLSVVNDIEKVYVCNIKGCPECKHTGVVARTVVSEVVIPDETLMAHLRKGDRMAAMKYWRDVQKGRSLLEHTISKISNGEVDPFQAEVVVGSLAWDEVNRDFQIEPEELKRF